MRERKIFQAFIWFTHPTARLKTHFFKVVKWIWHFLKAHLDTFYFENTCLGSNNRKKFRDECHYDVWQSVEMPFFDTSLGKIDLRSFFPSSLHRDWKNTSNNIMLIDRLPFISLLYSDALQNLLLVICFY